MMLYSFLPFSLRRVLWKSSCFKRMRISKSDQPRLFNPRLVLSPIPMRKLKGEDVAFRCGSWRDMDARDDSAVYGLKG